MSDFLRGRRDFLRRGFQVSTGIAVAATTKAKGQIDAEISSKEVERTRNFNGIYRGSTLGHVAFPMGGMGAGMICLEGTGALSNFSLHHDPELERERRVVTSILIKESPNKCRVLEANVPKYTLTPRYPGADDAPTVRGLPRFHGATFEARFPFAKVHLEDGQFPLDVSITGWSPFFPGDADNSSLPVAALEYEFRNSGETAVEAVFTFDSENFMSASSQGFGSSDGTKSLDRILRTPRGFILYGAGAPNRPWEDGHFAAWVDDSNAEVSYSWPLGSLEVQWRQFVAGESRPSDVLLDCSTAGASIHVPLKLAAGASKTVTVSLAWYVPRSNLYQPKSGSHGPTKVTYGAPQERYRPWYAGRFSRIEEIISYWDNHFTTLRQKAQLFSNSLFDSTLPPEVVEAVTSNLSILKSTTVLRQTDGQLWGWEGSMAELTDYDRTGISGTSTHVWNYAQAVPHLFPSLERGLREVEHGTNQNAEGLQYCRTPLPIRPVEAGHTFPDGPAADGQLGGIIKVYREWRVSGDTAWLRHMWPNVRASLEYCIRTWDPRHRGCIEEPHLTTYDMDFWGSDSFCTSLYLGALAAARVMGEALGDSVRLFSQLLQVGAERMETHLFNGEYFFQDNNWDSLTSDFPKKDDPAYLVYPDSPQLRDLTAREGPVGQYGEGCLSDGIIGEWLCLMSGLGGVLDQDKVERHLISVHRYNFKDDLTRHTNFWRTSFACGNESGLVVCSWPRGTRPTLPITVADEVWTGIEYQVASHLIAVGRVKEGLEIVQAVRRRYDGSVRNPFAEVEAGHWYARAMSSYALLQASSGARYDAVDEILYLKPAIKGDFRCFIATATGFGTVGVDRGEPFLQVASGTIPYRRIDYVPR